MYATDGAHIGRRKSRMFLQSLEKADSAQVTGPNLRQNRPNPSLPAERLSLETEASTAKT